MSDEPILVKDLPEDEKTRIINSFKELSLSGVPLKMEVAEAEALIAKKRAEKANCNVDNTSVTNKESADSVEQSVQENVASVTKPEDVTQETEIQKQAANKNKSKPQKKEKESDGICVICGSQVYSGICSGCGTAFRR